MSALLNKNTDNSFSLHMQENELRALIALLSVVEHPHNNGISTAAMNLRKAIKDEIGAKRFSQIWEDEVIISVYAGDEEADVDWNVYFGDAND